MKTVSIVLLLALFFACIDAAGLSKRQSCKTDDGKGLLDKLSPMLIIC
jgi:hypothetical protein